MWHLATALSRASRCFWPRSRVSVWLKKSFFSVSSSVFRSLLPSSGVLGRWAYVLGQ